ncbi:hypothetical protein ACPA1H_24675 [Ectopseudomonas chengduensis]
MHADRDDAPLRSQKKSGILKWMVALGIGTGITAGMLFVASMNTGKNQQKSTLTITTSQQEREDQQRAEKRQEIDWDKIVEEQARRDAANDQRQVARIDKEAERRRIQAEQERKANAAIATINAPAFGDGAKDEPKGGSKLTVTGIKSEGRLSDFCPYKEGSIERRNCKQSVNLNTRN